MSSRSRLRVLVAAFVMAVVLIAASVAAAANAAHAAKYGSLTVAVPVENDLPLYVGVGAGIFAKYGVDVKILEGQGANVANDVASGQADIGAIGPSAVLLLNRAGQHTKIITALGGGGLGASMIANKISGLTDFKPGCKIATFPIGTSAYGATVILIRKYHLGCSIVSLPNQTAQLAQLAAGQVDAVVGAPNVLVPAVLAGQAHWVIDTTTKKYADILGRPVPQGVEFALTSTIASKRQTLIHYLKARLAARALIQKTPVATLYTKYLTHFQAFAGISPKDAETQLTFQLPFDKQGSIAGFITKKTWQGELEVLASYGLPNYSITNPTFSYENSVDMSLYIAAAGDPTKKPKKK